MKDLNSDLLLNVFSYLSVKDNARIVQCCKRYLYLIETFQSDFVEPELVSSSSDAVRITGQSNQKIVDNGAQESRGKALGQDGVRRSPRAHKKETASKAAGTTRVLDDALSRMRVPPNIAFCFYKNRSACNELYRVHRLPSSTTIVGAMSRGGIQADSNGDSEFCCMLGSFPRARFVPFLIPTVADVPDCPAARRHSDAEGGGQSGAPEREGISRLVQLLRAQKGEGKDRSKGDGRMGGEEKENDDHYWKVFVVYVSGSGYPLCQDFLRLLQDAYPRAAVVGGVCDRGDLRLEPRLVETYADILRSQLRKENSRQLKRRIVVEYGHDALRGLNTEAKLIEAIVHKTFNASPPGTVQISNGIYGIAIGGDVPVRSIVSRGVKSVTDPCKTPWVVDRCSYLRPEDPDYPFTGPPCLLKPAYLIHTVRNESNPTHTSSMPQFFSRIRSRPQYIGMRTSEKDGYRLQECDGMMVGESLAIMEDGGEGVREGTAIDFFAMDGQTCLDDVRDRLSRLREGLVGEKLLGAIMFSCNGRGPGPGLIQEHMADANTFLKTFPGLPCVGLYAQGEIGPEATAGGSIFSHGRVALQGFTVVFAVFVVPASHSQMPHGYDPLHNDDDLHIDRYVQKRFQGISQDN